MQRRRSLNRLVAAIVALLAVASLLVVAAFGRLGAPRSLVMPRAMGAVMAIDRAMQRCAASRPDGRYQDDAGPGCLDVDALVERDRSLEPIRAAGLQVHVTSTHAGRGYVVQVGSTGEAPAWFAIARDPSGVVVQRRCSNAPLGSPDTDLKVAAHIPDCDRGRWRDPRS